MKYEKGDVIRKKGANKTFYLTGITLLRGK